MTPETLSELKSLLEKATPEDWKGLSMAGSTVDFIEALLKNAPDLIKAVEQRDRYRTALAKIRFHRGKDNFLRPILDKALKDTKEETNDTRTTA